MESEVTLSVRDGDFNTVEKFVVSKFVVKIRFKVIWPAAQAALYKHGTTQRLSLRTR